MVKRKNRQRDLKRNEVIQISNEEVCVNLGYIINACNLEKMKISGTEEVWGNPEIAQRFGVSVGSIIYVKITHDEKSMIPSGGFANILSAEVETGLFLPAATETEKYMQLAKIESENESIFKITERLNDNIWFAMRNLDGGSSS